MKKILLISLLLIVGCSKEPINYKTALVKRDGIYYPDDTNKPYSGPVFSLDDDGKKFSEGTLKDGEFISQTVWDYYPNGRKMDELNFKNGELEGLWTSWYQNGQKKFEGNYKDGEQISLICWDRDGNECECDDNLWYSEGCK